MRKVLVSGVSLVVLMAPFVAGCDSPRYVDNNGKEYYNANDVSTDTTPDEAYTRGGQYVNNPTDTTSTRDNRGNRPTGYGHDVNNDYYQPPAGTVVYTTPAPATFYNRYPPGSTLNSDGSITYPDGTTVYPTAARTTTTTVITR